MLPVPGRRIVFLHAHPDDETLATGALLAALAADGYDVAVVTATRGEQGEVVPGRFAALAGTQQLVAHRIGELAGALAELGAFVGVPRHTAGARPGSRRGSIPTPACGGSPMRSPDRQEMQARTA